MVPSVFDDEPRIPRRPPDHPGSGGSTSLKLPRRSKNKKAGIEIGLQLLAAAKDGDAEELDRLIREGAPVNFVDPVDHATALHYIAAYDARPALRVILKSGKCDFLVRDWEGRLPSEIAREYGQNSAMARLLLIKEMRQAQEQGIDPRGLYKISSRKRTP
jgi:ankyrin repeat protein